MNSVFRRETSGNGGRAAFRHRAGKPSGEELPEGLLFFSRQPKRSQHGVVYALEEKPEVYGLPADPSIPTSIFLWKDVVRPLGILGFWGSVAAVVVHYVTFGSRQLEEDGKGKGGDANG